VPSLTKSLMSVGALTDKGGVVVFAKTKCWLLDNLRNKNIIAAGIRDPANGLYKFTSQHEVNSVVLEN